jgi:protein disulfide-isomerase A6
MKVTFVLISIFSTIHAMYESASSKVETLTAANFDKMVLKSDEIWFIEFYAPWCGHCKNLEPHWDTAARKLKGVVKFGAIDCDAEENKSTCGKYGI